MNRPDQTNRLRKELGLFDVYAIATGAMFSSGFFLLPGLAAAKGGPAVALAYLLAGVLILPSMFSKAELSAALPRAGGTYYFLDRALGPMFGTIGGLGTFLALSLKTAFALVGIGAYASIFVELPIKPVAIALTVAFVTINVLGAKETSSLQRVLVVILLTVLAYFLAFGLFEISVRQPVAETRDRFSPFLPHGIGGLVSTIGFVFVSYAGLTKVASVAEEVKNPDRNIPLGMMLSLASTTFVYVVGVFIIVALVEPGILVTDLTPVATATEQFSIGLPAAVAVPLIVIAALAAFASTGNAGIMSASRYPLAMARDKLLPGTLSRLGRFQTPTLAIIATGGLMIFFILVLDEEGIAKLASAFQLFIFMLVNFAVIVMRESRIPSYDPKYRSPLYPWMQVAGILISIVLIAAMGLMAILFTASVVVACLLWYHFYARDRVVRDGAIYHWFNRLGQRQYDALDVEFRTILKEKGLRVDDPFDQVIARAQVIEIESGQSFDEIIRAASKLLADRLPLSAEKLEQGFLRGTRTGQTPAAGGAALPHLHVPQIDEPEIVLARSRAGLRLEVTDSFGEAYVTDEPIYAVFFLVSPEEDPGRHLRMLAQLANIVDDEEFIKTWLAASSVAHIKELLLRDAHYLTLRVRSLDTTATLIGAEIQDAGLPKDCLVAIIRRGDQMIVPHGDTVLSEGDRVTLIGEPDALERLRETYQGADYD
jgi:amino acid transporter/mannitol/fructose-specific phosphotransferase system IIA component (Ntr-type)